MVEISLLLLFIQHIIYFNNFKMLKFDVILLCNNKIFQNEIPTLGRKGRRINFLNDFSLTVTE